MNKFKNLDIVHDIIFNDGTLYQDGHAIHKNGITICMDKWLVDEKSNVVYGFEYEITGGEVISFEIILCHQVATSDDKNLAEKKWIDPNFGKDECLHHIKNIIFLCKSI